MKTTFRGILTTISFSLTFAPVLFSQGNNNIAQPVSTDNIRSYINTIKEKADQAYNYAEQASQTTTIPAANASAKQILLILEEIKNIVKNEQTGLDALSTPENKYKSGRYLNSIASDIVALQNKIEWATREANKLAVINELVEVKFSANEIMTDTKKMKAIVAETNNSLAHIDNELSATE